MRTLHFSFSLLLLVGTGCGNGSGLVLSGIDGGGSEPTFPPAQVDCATGPNFTGCSCKAGTTRACYTGPSPTRGVGPCKDGVQSCVAQGGENPTYAFGNCTGEVVPTASVSCTGGDGGCRPMTCAMPQQVWDAVQCACVTPATDGGCRALPIHCAEGFVFDNTTCQCVAARDGGGSVCGGIAGIICPSGFYCDNFPVIDPCGGGDMFGTCTAISTLPCPSDCAGVCGCDNKTYCNACAAHGAGTAIRKMSNGC